jgi:hypothetical protein
MFSKYVGGIVYPSFGCRIYVPAGGTVGDVITTPFINSLGHFGVPRVPLLENWYISWHSNDPNFYDGVAAPIFVDYDQNQVPLGSGTVYWTPSGVAPHQGNAWTPTSLAGSNGIHIAVS